MDLLSYWKAVTSENSAEKCIRGITGEKKYKRVYDKLCSHSSWEDTENLLLGLGLFIHTFTHVLVGKSSLSPRLSIQSENVDIKMQVCEGMRMDTLLWNG